MAKHDKPHAAVGGSSPTAWPPGALDPVLVSADRIVSLHQDGSVSETKPTPEEVEAAASLCSVCGQGGNLTGAAGAARWHAACEVSHPAVIEKVKARA